MATLTMSCQQLCIMQYIGLLESLNNALRLVVESHVGLGLYIILIRKKLADINYITCAGIIKHFLVPIILIKKQFDSNRGLAVVKGSKPRSHLLFSSLLFTAH